MVLLFYTTLEVYTNFGIVFGRVLSSTLQCNLVIELLLICWCAVTVDLIIPNGIAALAAAVAGVAFHGVDYAVLYFLHDANMICDTVLTILIIPIKEDEITGAGFIAIVLP